MKKNKLHKIRLDILDVAKKNVIFYGWNDEIINSIVSEKKFNKEEVFCLFPKGSKSILELYLSNLNNEMTQACKKINLSKMKTPEKVREIILLRLKMNKKEKKLIKKTFFTLMLPQHSKLATSTLFSIVDQIWYIAGDKSTDFSYYTKRAILALIYSSTIFYWFNNHYNLEKTKNFLNQQLTKVAMIPKIKQNFKTSSTFLLNFFSLAKEFKQ